MTDIHIFGKLKGCVDARLIKLVEHFVFKMVNVGSSFRSLVKTLFKVVHVDLEFKKMNKCS